MVRCIEFTFKFAYPLIRVRGFALALFLSAAEIQCGRIRHVATRAMCNSPVLAHEVFEKDDFHVEWFLLDLAVEVSLMTRENC